MTPACGGGDVVFRCDRRRRAADRFRRVFHGPHYRQEVAAAGRQCVAALTATVVAATVAATFRVVAAARTQRTRREVAGDRVLSSSVGSRRRVVGGFVLLLSAERRSTWLAEDPLATAYDHRCQSRETRWVVRPNVGLGREMERCGQCSRIRRLFCVFFIFQKRDLFLFLK